MRCGLSLRLTDADRDGERHQECNAMPDREAERFACAEAERLENRHIGTVRDHAGAYPGIVSARSQRPITHTSTPTNDT